MRSALLLVILALGLGGCSSPEAARARGGGPGADVGNVKNPIEFHGEKDMFNKTPQRGPRR
jgi:hypothetical protein